MKKSNVPVISAFIIVISYLLIRYPLFPYHGMKQFPLILGALSMVITVAANFSNCMDITSIMTTIGYVLGFGVGLIFKTETIGPNGRENNLCLIWLIIYLVFIITGIIINVVNYKKKIKPNIKKYAEN